MVHLYKQTMRIMAAGEAATGLALMLFPQLVAQFLFGAGTAGSGLAFARIAGIALVSLGIACWPGAINGSGSRRARIAMLVYSALATLYLGFVAIDGELRGPLLWAAVFVHLVMTVLLGAVRDRRAT